MTRCTVLAGLAALAWLACPALSAQADNGSVRSAGADAAAVAEEPAATGTSDSNLWWGVGGGCLGGAAAGTILPGIGNVVGCAAGALAVWWWRRP